MSDYWKQDSLERLLSERTAVLNPETEIPAMLVAAGMIHRDNQNEAAELLSEHQDGWSETEYDAYCKCGKWLEIGTYDLEDHQAQVLEDARLVVHDIPDETRPVSETC